MCEIAAAWPWSSHRAALGRCSPGLLALDELLSYFAADRARARARYRELTEADVTRTPVHGNGVIAGSPDFVRRHLRGVVPSAEIPAGQRRSPRPSLEDVLEDDSMDAIACAYRYGYTMPAIARHLGPHTSTVSRRLSRLGAQIKT